MIADALDIATALLLWFLLVAFAYAAVVFVFQLRSDTQFIGLAIAFAVVLWALALLMAFEDIAYAGALFLFGALFVAWSIYLARIGTASRHQTAHPKNHIRYAPRPPTDRQLAYIDSLIDQKEVEPGMIERDPATLEEASELIDDLLDRPYKTD